MKDTDIPGQPLLYAKLLQHCKETGFTMPSDICIGTLLKTLVASKPGSNCLEMGTGIGLSLVWMADGMDKQSRLTSIDNDPELTGIVSKYFEEDPRVEIICTDGGEWLRNYRGAPFDLIFADTWPGKYTDIEEALALVNPGGFYIVDDMDPQPNWPEGHESRAGELKKYLKKRVDFTYTQLDWSTGVIVCTKIVRG